MRGPKPVTISSHSSLANRDRFPGLEGSLLILERADLPDPEVGKVFAISATACVVRAARGDGDRFVLSTDGSVKSTLYVAETSDGHFDRTDPRKLFTVKHGAGFLAVNYWEVGDFETRGGALLDPRTENPGSLAVGPSQIDAALAGLRDGPHPLAAHTYEVTYDAMDTLRNA